MYNQNIKPCAYNSITFSGGVIGVGSYKINTQKNACFVSTYLTREIYKKFCV
jgi:hypothetical protein